MKSDQLKELLKKLQEDLSKEEFENLVKELGRLYKIESKTQEIGRLIIQDSPIESLERELKTKQNLIEDYMFGTGLIGYVPALPLRYDIYSKDQLFSALDVFLKGSGGKDLTEHFDSFPEIWFKPLKWYGKWKDLVMLFEGVNTGPNAFEGIGRKERGAVADLIRHFDGLTSGLYSTTKSRVKETTKMSDSLMEATYRLKRSG